MNCEAYAGNLSSGLICYREDGHPGHHRDNDLNVYWMPGAPPLETIELTQLSIEPERMSRVRGV